jgi:hypothetical protein
MASSWSIGTIVALQRKLHRKNRGDFSHSSCTHATEFNVTESLLEHIWPDMS